MRGAKTRLLELAPRASGVGWRGGCFDCPQRPVRGGCFDGPQRALKRGARYDQATATSAAAALRWLSVLLLLLCYGALLEKGKSRERHFFIRLRRFIHLFFVIKKKSKNQTLFKRIIQLYQV